MIDLPSVLLVKQFPHTLYMVTGSQADRSERNQLTLLLVSELHKTHAAADSEEESEDDADALDEDPVIEHQDVKHVGAVNRLRCMPASGGTEGVGLVATMADSGHLHVFDLRASLASMLAAGPRQPPPTRPMHSQALPTEGYALDWATTVAGRLAAGTNDGQIRVLNQRAVTSIEWAPHDESVLALSSADDQLTLWDLSVEAEASTAASGGQPAAFPAQLLFIHAGQRNVKELRHHPQIPGLLASTAEDSFNVFKPAISVSS